MSTGTESSDPYALLGVSTQANEAEIRKAWRRKTRSAGPGSAEFAALNEAAELLLDPARRRDYDADHVSEVEVPAEPTTSAQLSRRSLLAGWQGTAVVAGGIAAFALVLAVWQGIAYGTRDSSSPGPGTGGVPAANYSQPQSNQQAALAAVQTGLPAVLSYRYDSMAADQANAERFLTGKAKPGLEASYKRLINGGAVPGCKSELAPIATRKTVVEATVVAAGVVSVGQDSAQIGAFVNQTTTSANQAAVTTQNRVLVSLVKQGGSWLIDSMTVPNTDHVLTC